MGTSRVIHLFLGRMYEFSLLYEHTFTLMEESSLRVFENRLLRRMFDPKRAEVSGKWRKLHKEKLSDL